MPIAPTAARTELSGETVARGGDWLVLAGLVGWITAVLLVDRSVGVGGQALLGSGTWVVLLVALRRESLLVRVQTAVVIAFATLVEYVFCATLEVYEYRLGGVAGVPSFVPPGHGLVYLAALLVGRAALVRARMRLSVAVTLLLGGGYAWWGLVLSDRPDALGAFWFVCLAGFLAFGRRRGLYVGCFFVVTYLEVLGTAVGTWEWQPYGPLGIVSMGNPPSGAAGGYGWFDLAAVLLAPVLISWWRGRSSRRRTRRPPAPLLRYPEPTTSRPSARRTSSQARSGT